MKIPKTNSLLFSVEELDKIEAKMNASYVGDFCLKDKEGNYLNFPVAVFYVEQPAKKEFSNYFALYFHDKKVYITDGLPAVEDRILTGFLDEEGNYVFSVYRHDYRQVGDLMIDGGPEYTRSSVPADKLLTAKVVKDEIIIDGI